MTFGESTSGSHWTSNMKVISFGVWFLDMVHRCGENIYEQGES
jgi:hypothetical protein